VLAAAANVSGVRPRIYSRCLHVGISPYPALRFLPVAFDAFSTFSGTVNVHARYAIKRHN